MSALFDFWSGMMRHLWQTTLVFAAVFLLDAALRNAPSRVRHILWSIAFAKLFVPVSLLGGFAALVHRAVVSAPESAAATPQLPVAVAVVLYPVGAAARPATGSAPANVLVAASAVWASFTLYFLARAAVVFVRSRRLGGEPLASADPVVRGRLERIARAAGVPVEAVRIGGAFIMPTVAGFLRPWILFPQHLARELSDEEMRSILLHEDAHRRRRDPLRGLVCSLAAAPFFFYPAIYPVLRRLRDTAEFACDERVIRSGVAAPAYASALARSIRLGLLSPAFASAAAGSPALLKSRLRRIRKLSPGRLTMRSWHIALLAFAFVFVVAGLFLPEPMRAKGPEVQLPVAAVTAGTPVSVSPAEGDQDSAEKRKTGDRERPAAIVTHQPVYPESALKSGVSARITLRVLVTETGDVAWAAAEMMRFSMTTGKGKTTKTIEVEGETADETFDEMTRGTLKPAGEGLRIARQIVDSAVEAVKQWKFEPATMNGAPVAMEIKMPISFKLNGHDSKKALPAPPASPNEPSPPDPPSKS